MNERLNNIKFSNVDILKILKNLDINEAHGHGNLLESIYEETQSVNHLN